MVLLVACNGTPKTEKGNIETNDNPIMVFLRKKVPGDTTGLPVLDLQKKYHKNVVYLQDIADIEYIVLETHDDALVTSQNTTVTDSFIVTINAKTNDVVFFRRDGSFSHIFNRKGGSSMEYSSFGDVYINPQKNEVYVNDAVRAWVQVYSYNGDYKRTLKLRGDGYTWGRTYFNDSESLLAEDRKNVDNEIKRYTNPKPFYKISIIDGTKSQLPLTIENRIGNGFNAYDKDTGQFFSTGVDLCPISNINGELIISDFALDTIYKYQNDKLIPIARKENWMKDNEVPYIVALDAMTDDFFLWCAIEKDIKKVGWPIKTFLQNRHTGECAWVELVDKNIIDCNFFFRRISTNAHILPENTILQYYAAYKLKGLYEQGLLRGELKDIASKLQEEDNPVLMLAKFK